MSGELQVVSHSESLRIYCASAVLSSLIKRRSHFIQRALLDLFIYLFMSCIYLSWGLDIEEVNIYKETIFLNADPSC